jgi:two-component system NarL family response regulator
MTGLPRPMPPRRIRVLCVDDHRVVREGVSSMINREPDMEVVASAATGEESIELFQRHRPDITLMDLQLPCMSGLEAIQAIRRHDASARIVVLTVYQGDEDIYRALRAGATTYLLKDTLTDDLVSTIRAVHIGRRPIPPNIQALLAARRGAPTLTEREIEVLRLVVTGMRNKGVAARLGISEETAKVHVRNIFTKLEVSDRTAAMAVALRRGIIHIP